MAALAELVAELRVELRCVLNSDWIHSTSAVENDDIARFVQLLPELPQLLDVADENERLRALLGEAAAELVVHRCGVPPKSDLERRIEAALLAQRQPEVERDDGSDQG